jgi:NAD(P)-dependent dehydrogenase (short-subunit alcohol dehydrogenase family)
VGQPCTFMTGAGSGFGRSIAQHLASTRDLVLADMNAQRVEKLQSSFTSPRKHHSWIRDLSNLDGLGNDLSSLMSSAHIEVDHFVHCAGVFGIQLVRGVNMEFVNHLFTVNLFSAMEIVRVLTQKRVNKNALKSVTFISAIGSRIGGKGYSIYASSKGAINALSLSLAVELAPAVRVNAVLPGTIETEMNKSHFGEPEFVQAMQAIHPLGLGRPEDVAEAVDFLASERARWITGQEIVVDGGRFARKSPIL